MVVGSGAGVLVIAGGVVMGCGCGVAVVDAVIVLSLQPNLTELIPISTSLGMPFTYQPGVTHVVVAEEVVLDVVVVVVVVSSLHPNLYHLLAYILAVMSIKELTIQESRKSKPTSLLLLLSLRIP